MRQIENREFSNRDKIMLLLSAHCDFPTKEDLISTVSFDKMLEDEEEMAANASMTGRRPKTDGSTPETAGSPPQSTGETAKPDSPAVAGETAKPDSPVVAEVETKPNTADSGNAKPAAPAVRTAKPDASVARKDFDWRKMTPEERERVELYLQNILYTILKDESVLLTVRGRALEALAYFNTEKNIKMLTFILTHSERIKRPMMLVQAIRAFPEVAPDKAAEILAPFLEHENDMVRFVTIRTLQKTPGNEAVQVMQKRLDVETNRFFKARLQESIQCHDQKQTNCR